MFKKLLLCIVATSLAVAVGTSYSGAQVGLKSTPEKPAAKKKERAKARGRLPNFYRYVVTEEQREKIYKIQADYRAQIKALQDQINALKKKQAEEIEAVITPEQKAKIEKLIEDAKAKREKAAQEKKAAAQSGDATKE